MNFNKRVNGSWVDTPNYIHNTSTDAITTLPTVIYPTDTMATVGLKGQTIQSSTPSPTSPVMPQGTGDKTANLFDGQLQQGFYAYLTGDYNLADAYVCTHLIPCTENTTYTFRCINTGGGSKNYGYVFFDSAQNRIDSDYINELTEGDVVTHTATTPQNTAFLAINIAYGRRQPSVVRPSDITDFMLNTGSTAKPYEPYGYKIPISSTSTTTPVYLGEVETTRKIKQLVLTGDETSWSSTDSNAPYRITLPDIVSTLDRNSVLFLSTHYLAVSNNESWAQYNTCVSWSFASNTNVKCLQFRDTNQATLADFKTYLQQQYAAGTPVTVWYVLANEETGIVNEPLMKIGGYADTLSNVSIPVTAGGDTISVGTTLQPSEAAVNYKGWHPASVKEYHFDKTISDLEDMTISQMQTYTIISLQGGNWS